MPSSSIHFCAILIFIIGTFPNGRIGARLISYSNQTTHTAQVSLKAQQDRASRSPFAGVHSFENQTTGVVIADVPHQRRRSRRKRSVLQLASMLKCVTGCSPLAFHGYGCFCGYMGDGSPVDPIDSCCLQHDWCYSSTHCSNVATYFLPYDWQCEGLGYAYCGLAGSTHGHASCARQLCACDIEFARCISKYPCPNQRAKCRQGRSFGRKLFNGR